jgi:hypothetical protein
MRIQRWLHHFLTIELNLAGLKFGRASHVADIWLYSTRTNLPASIPAHKTHRWGVHIANYNPRKLRIKVDSRPNPNFSQKPDSVAVVVV